MYFLIPLLNLFLLEFSIKFSVLIYFSGIILFSLTFYSIYRWVKIKNTGNYGQALVSLKLSKNLVFWLIYFSLSLFILSFLFLLIFLENKTLIHFLIILESFGIFIFLYIIYHIFKTEKIKLNYAVQNLIGYFNLASFFFMSANLLFLDLNTTGKFFYFFLLFSLIVFGISVLSLKIYNISIFNVYRNSFIYILILEIIMLELFWILGYFPISIYTRAGILSLFYYFTLGIFRHYLIWGISEITFKVVKRYVLISSLGVALLLATARWR